MVSLKWGMGVVKGTCRSSESVWAIQMFFTHFKMNLNWKKKRKKGNSKYKQIQKQMKLTVHKTGTTTTQMKTVQIILITES